MRINPPTKIVFWISAIVAVLGLIAFFIAPLKPFAVFIVFVGYVLLFLGNTLKGF